jgi:hypothetical protein
LATLECIRTQCNAEGKVAKYSRFFHSLAQTVVPITKIKPMQTRRADKDIQEYQKAIQPNEMQEEIVNTEKFDSAT